jgi:hypothetical protein
LPAADAFIRGLNRRMSMTLSVRLLSAAALLIALPMASPAVGGDARSAIPPGQTQSAPDIPDKKLDAAAAALKRIAGLRHDFREQLAKAVTDQGLSIDEYAAIIDVAQADPDVRDKLLERVGPLKDADD